MRLKCAKYAQQTKGWFYELLTARDTEALTEQQMEEALAEYRALYGHDMGEGQFRQEYFCDFQTQLLGSFYTHEMLEVRNEGRIMECEPIEGEFVHRAWDLGVGDDTSIWWFQAQPSGQLLILDHYAASGVGVEHYRDLIFERETERGWRHGNDYVPHDAKVQEFGTGRTRVETMASMGLDLSWFRKRLSMMGLTPSEEAYLYASFIRALNTVASRRLNSTGASGTTSENASSPTPFMTGPATQPTLSDTLPNPGEPHPDAK